jgi:hypothetical protein
MRRRGRRTAAALVASILVLLAGCTGSGHPSPSSTAPSSTGPPGPSSTAAPGRCGFQLASFPVTVEARPGTDPGVVHDVREGVSLARRVFRATVPTCERGEIRVVVLDRDLGSIAAQTLVQAAPRFTMQVFGRGAFERTPASLRPIVILHEWYHVLQFALIDCGTKCLPLAEPVPDWLIEGAAVEESLWEGSRAHLGFYSFFRAGEVAQAGHVGDSLESLDKIRLPGTKYALAFAAVELLVNEHGHESLERLWARTGATGDWRRAFRRTFGEPVGRFYKEFETYRTNGFET